MSGERRLCEPFNWRDRSRLCAGPKLRRRAVRLLQSPACAAMLRRLIYAAVLGCQRSQNQEKQRIRRRVQSEIEEAVNEDRKASGQRAGDHAAPKMIVSLTARKAPAKQNQDEPQTQPGTDDAAVRKCLQIIIVCPLQPK